MATIILDLATDGNREVPGTCVRGDESPQGRCDRNQFDHPRAKWPKNRAFQYILWWNSFDQNNGGELL